MVGSSSSLSDIYTKDACALLDDELRMVRDATYEELMRASGTMHLVPVVESLRRLRESIHTEERAIKRLTWVLVVLTVVLAYLGVIGYLRQWRS
jgi:hypothetical protein